MFQVRAGDQVMVQVYGEEFAVTLDEMQPGWVEFVATDGRTYRTSQVVDVIKRAPMDDVTKRVNELVKFDLGRRVDTLREVLDMAHDLEPSEISIDKFTRRIHQLIKNAEQGRDSL